MKLTLTIITIIVATFIFLMTRAAMDMDADGLAELKYWYLGFVGVVILAAVFWKVRKVWLSADQDMRDYVEREGRE